MAGSQTLWTSSPKGFSTGGRREEGRFHWSSRSTRPACLPPFNTRTNFSEFFSTLGIPVIAKQMAILPGSCTTGSGKYLKRGFHQLAGRSPEWFVEKGQNKREGTARSVQRKMRRQPAAAVCWGHLLRAYTKMPTWCSKFQACCLSMNQNQRARILTWHYKPAMKLNWDVWISITTLQCSL